MRSRRTTPDADRLDTIREKMNAPQEALDAVLAVLSEKPSRSRAGRVERAHACQLAARALRLLGRHAEALPYFAEAASVATDAGENLLALQLRVGEVDSLGMMGRWTEARELAQTLEAGLMASGATEDAAKVLGNLGSLYLRNDRYEEALAAYGRADTLMDGKGSPLVRAGLIVNQAIALTYLGRYEDAEDRYAVAQTLYNDQDRPFESAVVGTNLGFLHHNAGRHGLALAHLTTASRIFEETGREHELARCEVDRGDVYRSVNLLREAEECYSRALGIFGRLPLEYDEARAELGSAAALFQQGRIEAARNLVDRAQSRFAGQNNEVQIAHTRLLFSLLEQQAGNTEEMARTARVAAEIFTRHGLEGWAAEARFLLAQSNPDETAQVKELEEIIAIAHRTTRGWLECRAERVLGNVYLRAGRRFAAGHHLRRSVQALESIRVQVAPEELHLSFLSDKETIYADFVELLLSGPRSEADVVEALQVLEGARSRLLLERILAHQKSAAPAAETQPGEPESGGEIWGRLSRLRAELSRTYREALSLEPGESRRPHTTRDKALSALEAAYARLLRDADSAGLLPPGAFQATALNVDDLQAALNTEENLIVYARIGDGLGAFIVRQDRIHVLPRLAAWDTVTHAIHRFHFHMQKMELAPDLRMLFGDRLRPELDGVLHTLYDLIIRPLVPNITGNRLIIAPCGPLFNLPVHALLSENGYALDRWEISYTPSAAIWLALTRRIAARTQNRPLARTPAPECRSLVVGVSEPGIARVTDEVRTVAPRLTAATVLSDAEATCEAVRQQLSQAKVCHIATHALFREDNPLFSGLHLADGWLLARDLYSLSLNADLITLSACATGMASVAAGGEWMGLARGFLAAGARRVIASLWSADDAATAFLMDRFYTHREMLGTVAALRVAQQETRTRWPHPYHWSAFCLVGCR